MVLARLATVRPRVLSPLSGNKLLLEEEIRALLAKRARGVVRLLGGAGAGRSTALAHLAAVFADEPRVCCLDDRDPVVVDADLMVRASHGEGTEDHVVATYCLAAWDEDDYIEYLLGMHPKRCGSVITRLRGTQDDSLLGGNPELCGRVLDLLARDDRLTGAYSGLRHLTRQEWADPELRERFARQCGQWLVHRLGQIPQTGLLRHEATQIVLAAEWIAVELEARRHALWLQRPLSQRLVRAIGREVADRPQALRMLKKLLASADWHWHAMVASILHATETGWAPRPSSRWRPRRRRPMLAGAYLANASWPGVTLRKTNLTGASLRQADLSEANLFKAVAAKVDFRAAVLHGASLRRLLATEADLADADLTFVLAGGACFDEADLRRANLEGAQLARTSFRGANLTGARLIEANLRQANLTGARIDGADFTGANLAQANLAGLPLRRANLPGARLARADLSRCDLSNMELTQPNWRQVLLVDANLVGSVFSSARLTRANLRGARLEGIVWENSDLRHADLDGASFGPDPVGWRANLPPLPHLPQHSLPRASLRGSDLRGAKLESVDFFAVDMRRCRLTRRQEAHLRRCGAIL